MTTLRLERPEFVDMKGNPTFTERWLHDHLKDDPSLLGRGFENVVALDSERRQPGAGRLDLLLENPTDRTRYEVEIQLGSVDESHIIRTIEYWDIERRRYPKREHIAVIVAEDITSRFLNVISLFNGSIPLIAIQLKCVKVVDGVMLVATRVLDAVPLGTEEDDGGEVTDRAYWSRKSTPAVLQTVDKLLESAREIESGTTLNYTKFYIGMRPEGQSRNFLLMWPTKNDVRTYFKMPQTDELDEWIADNGLSFIDYDSHYGGHYRVRINQHDLTETARRENVQALIRKARAATLGTVPVG